MQIKSSSTGRQLNCLGKLAGRRSSTAAQTAWNRPTVGAGAERVIRLRGYSGCGRCVSAAAAATATLSTASSHHGAASASPDVTDGCNSAGQQQAQRAKD